MAFFTFFIFTLHSRNDQPLPIFLGNMSSFAESIMTIYGIALFQCRRTTLSKVMRKLNEMNWNMQRRTDSLKYRSQRNRIHLVCIGMFTMGMLLGLMASISPFFEFLATGEDHFKNHLTANRPSYSLWRFANCIFNILLIIWAVFFFTPIFTMITEIFLIIALNYRVLAADLRDIKIGKEENIVFNGLMKDLNVLQR